MNVNPTTIAENGTGTGKAGICVKGNLATPHLDRQCNGINIVIPFDDAVYIPMLLKELRFAGNGPEIDVVELLEGEELFDIKAMIATIEQMKAAKAPAKLKRNRKNSEDAAV